MYNPQIQPFSESLVPQPQTTGFPKNESLYQNQMFTAVWVWVQGPKVAKWLKWTGHSNRDYLKSQTLEARLAH